MKWDFSYVYPISVSKYKCKGGECMRKYKAPKIKEVNLPAALFVEQEIK